MYSAPLCSCSGKTCMDFREFCSIREWLRAAKEDFLDVFVALFLSQALRQDRGAALLPWFQKAPSVVKKWKNFAVKGSWGPSSKYFFGASSSWLWAGFALWHSGWHGKWQIIAMIWGKLKTTMPLKCALNISGLLFPGIHNLSLNHTGANQAETIPVLVATVGISDSWGLLPPMG